MASRPWIFLINPFIVATNTSYSLMKQIGNYTLAAINAKLQPSLPDSAKATAPPEADFFAGLLATLQPPVQTYDDAYTAWLSKQGSVKGQTKTLTMLLDDLSSNQIQEWDLAIQNVYRQNTPQYIALLPQHRKPFQQGTQQSKITAVGALSLAIGTDAKLQDLKADVDTFQNALVLANASQKDGKSNKSGSSAEVEADRIVLGIVLYGILGQLMDYYKETPEMIATVILVDALRTHEQTVFSQDVNGGQTKLVFTRTLEDGDQLKITGRGHTALQVALVHEKNDAMPADAFTVQAGEEELVLPDALGAKGNRYLIIKNLSATEKGAFTIEIV